MAKRVSLKGKGADLFFGDYPPGAEPVVESAEKPAEIVSDAEVTLTEHPASPEPTTIESDPVPPVNTELTLDGAAAPEIAAETPALTPEAPDVQPIDGTPDLLGVELIDTMWERLASQASISNSFRYTEPELDELADVLYRVSKDERVRLTKQDIARLGLNAVLWDYRHRGDASLLSTFARRKRRPQES